jgi:O-acetyl-ADP-ribose deacetylase (regulator of RNase III)
MVFEQECRNAMKFIVGDVTQPQGEGTKILVHVCNDAGGFGSGVAGAIAKWRPEVRQAYKEWHAKGENFALGMVQLVKLDDGIIVANMIAQHGYSYAGHPAIQYPALHMCLSKVAKRAKELCATIHAPRLGCGLAGGTWDKVEAIILDTMGDLDVTVYDLEKED